MFHEVRWNYARKVAALVVVLAGALGGCAQSGQTDKQDAGVLIGGIAGGLLGSQFGSGSGNVAATIGGAAAGATIGGAIGAAMDEEDRKEMARLTDRSFETGSVQEYTSPRTGAHVKVSIVKTEHAEKKLCRTASQEVSLTDGTSMTDTVTACRGPNGWVI